MSEPFVLPESWQDHLPTATLADGSTVSDLPKLPTFFFHLYSLGERQEDELGVDLPDVTKARWAARKPVNDLLSGSSPSDEMIESHRFEIADEGGETVLIYPFREGLSPPK